jgi:hypothetical protein
MRRLADTLRRYLGLGSQSDEPGAIIPYPFCFESILSFLNDSIWSSNRAISRWKSRPLRIGAAFTEANSAIELGRLSTPGIGTSSTNKGTIGTPNLGDPLSRFKNGFDVAQGPVLPFRRALRTVDLAFAPPVPCERRHRLLAPRRFPL